MTISADDTRKFVDPFQSMLSFQLRKTSVPVLGALADELAPLGLKPSEAFLLLLVGANPGCTQSDISRALPAKPANLVPLINDLVKAEMVERTPGRGRAIGLSLSAKGEALHEGVKDALARHEARIARNLSPEVCAQLIAVLQRVCLDACC